MLFAGTPTVTGFPNDKATAAVGIPLWNDRSYEILAMPEFLEGTILFQGPHRDVSSGTTITVETSPPSTIYVAFGNMYGVYGNLTSTLPSKGWALVSGRVKFAGPGGYLDKIWTKTVTTQHVEGFTTNGDELTHAIFVKEGNFSKFSECTYYVLINQFRLYILTLL